MATNVPTTMSYKPRSLFGLLEEIDNKSLFLPHIQRPFVWSEEQMRRLFDSLMQNYPIQTFLFWRTKDFIKVREFMTCLDWDVDLHTLYNNQKSSQGIEKVFVLDGQQRLQTLYTLFNGAVSGDTSSATRECYFDLTAGTSVNEEGLMFDIRFSSSPLPLPHYRLRDLMGKDSSKNAEEIAEEANDKLDHVLQEEPEQKKERQKRVRRNCGQIRALLKEEQYFWVQQLDGVAERYPYKVILEIFVRVNSGGTKLDAGDLMFAAMKEGWSEIEERVEEIAEMLSGGKLEIDKSFVLKCLVVAHGEGAELSPEKFSSNNLLQRIETTWQTAEEAFQQLRDFIENELRLFSPKVIRSYSAFIPLFDYLFQHPKPDAGNRASMQSYYYKAQLFNWFARGTDSTLNTLHRVISKAAGESFPLEDIRVSFANRFNTHLHVSHLSESRLRLILLNLLYVKKFGTSAFNVRFKGNEPHADHIFPQSPLRTKLGLNSDEINDIGNFRLIGASDNLRKRAELPADYFARLEKAGVPIVNHLILPEFAANPSLLKFDAATYLDFRTRRRAEIFQTLKQVIDPESLFDSESI